MPKRRGMRALTGAVFIAVLLTACPAGAAPEAPRPAANDAASEEAKQVAEEVRMGRRIAADLEREYKLVNDPAALARLARIGGDLTAVCGGPRYRYIFKILATNDINAVSLPGGFIYVTKGLLGFVRSDDELAGVLAHEIAHSSRRHVRELMRREEKLNRQMLFGMLGAILAGATSGEGFGSMLLGAEMLKTSFLSGYTQKVESEADRSALDYLIKTGRYNPVGALTVIERLARDEARRTGAPLGVYQTHPDSAQRATAMADYLRERGISIDRLAVQDPLRAVARAADPGTEVVLNGIVLYRTTAGQAVADAIAAHINRLIKQGLQLHAVSVGPDGISVSAAGEVVLTVSAADAALAGAPPADVAAQAAQRLRDALWKMMVEQTS